MPIKETYPIGSGNAIASYDFTDIAEGTGINVYNVSKSEIEGSGVVGEGTLNKTAFDMSANPPNIEYTASTLDSGAVTFELSPFNLPQVIKGTFHANFTIGALRTGGSYTWQVQIDILKNSDIIATEKTKERVITANAVTTHIVPITIPLTKYKKDDIFKVRFTRIESVGTGTIFLHHDNLNRDNSVIVPNVTAVDNPTRARVFVPFRIEID